MSRFITLPNGDIIEKKTVFAIQPREESKGLFAEGLGKVPPTVCVHFAATIGAFGNHSDHQSSFDCISFTEAKQIAAALAVEIEKESA